MAVDIGAPIDDPITPTAHVADLAHRIESRFVV
jgi:hypothetical protein